MLAEIEARLKDQVPALKKVEGAAEFAAIRGKTPSKHRLPAAFVIPVSDRAGPNRVANAVRQEDTETFGVVLAAGNLSDPRGASSSQALETLKRQVKTAIVGWAPEDGFDACTFSRGRTLSLSDGVVWMLLEFETSYFIRG